MKRFTFACVLFASLTGVCNAQTGRQVYGPYYNGWGQRPGLSVYSNGTYSVDYFGGSKSYHYGYVPARTYRPGRHYNAGNGLVPQTWMFYYPGMELSPYNVNSPIWGW